MINFSMAAKAKEHDEDIRRRFEEEIKTAISKTKIYSEQSEQCSRTVISLEESDSVSCLFDIEAEGKTAILNFASYTNPGGGYLSGMTTQEEDLCHKSFLYPVLDAMREDYYIQNAERKNRGLYLNRALYTPDVIFEWNGRQKKADVITCAAPNFNSASYRYHVTEEENNEVFEDRIRFMFNVAQDNNIDTLIAGAWGCGVFGQDPKFTARTMEKVINEGISIKKVVFAIPDCDSPNYRAFDEVLFGCINN